jgi:hypothetical protein
MKDSNGREASLPFATACLPAVGRLHGDGLGEDPLDVLAQVRAEGARDRSLVGVARRDGELHELVALEGLLSASPLSSDRRINASMNG